MKQSDTITNKIVRNINYALEAIPRALSTEKEPSVRKARSTQRKARKTPSRSRARMKARGITAKARGTARKAKRGVKKAASKVVRFPKKRAARKASSSRKQGRRTNYIAPVARAA